MGREQSVRLKEKGQEHSLRQDAVELEVKLNPADLCMSVNSGENIGAFGDLLKV